MILFPYAKDIEYEDNTLSLTLDFFASESHTEVKLAVRLDNNVAAVIEDLLIKEHIDEDL